MNIIKQRTSHIFLTPSSLFVPEKRYVPTREVYFEIRKRKGRAST